MNYSFILILGGLLLLATPFLFWAAKLEANERQRQRDLSKDNENR